MAWQSLRFEVGRDAAEALSDTLMALGALSVGIEDAQAETADELPIFGEPGVDEFEHNFWQKNVVKALFSADHDLDAIAGQATVGMHHSTYTIEPVPEQDWVRATQSQFEPIRISDRLWIIPSWHKAPQLDAINIVLDPGLAFGTGSHPTTHLCLRWLDENLHGGETVLDFGCGSGILAIAAKKLGAAKTVGVDIDNQAIISSRQNAVNNQVDAEFCLPDAMSTRASDVVVANILSSPLKVLAPLLAHSCCRGGSIVLSGILAEQHDEISCLYAQWFDMKNPVFMENWTMLSGIKR